ncbi:hypothetical protein JCM10450v2_000129 [Rhodotorula kratochvilovae]
MSTSRATLEVPDSPPPTPTNRHQLRQRSPKGQRGRPRKTRTPRGLPPPGRLRRWRHSAWFVPVAVVLVLGILALLFSAVRISVRSSDYSHPVVVRPATASPSPLSTPRRSPSSPAPASPEPNPPAEGKAGDSSAELHNALDDAVRHALEEAWQLPPDAHVGAANGAASTGADAAQEKPRQRTLAELYADLEELGMSAHELQEVFDEAVRESGERP